MSSIKLFPSSTDFSLKKNRATLTDGSYANSSTLHTAHILQ